MHVGLCGQMLSSVCFSGDRKSKLKLKVVCTLQHSHCTHATETFPTAAVKSCAALCQGFRVTKGSKAAVFGLVSRSLVLVLAAAGTSMPMLWSSCPRRCGQNSVPWRCLLGLCRSVEG